MNKTNNPWFRICVLASAALAAGCAVRPTPDPRAPAPVRDSPWVLRVCYVEGDGAHLAVGDQVELTTNRGGRLTIRHLPATGGQNPVWNGGAAAKVRDAVLVEMVAPRGEKSGQRRFVPVGRFGVRVGDSSEHAQFDFLTSKATINLEVPRLPDCKADLGDDEVIIRGVEDEGRHGGSAHLR
jgi:hypothetical protein